VSDSVQYPSSAKGFNNKLMFTVLFAVLFMIIEIGGVIVLFRDDDAPNWALSVIGGSMTLFGWLFTIGLYPSTYSVIAKDETMQVSKGKKVDFIPYSKISRIIPSTHLFNQGFGGLEYYRIELISPCIFGKRIYFRNKSSGIFEDNKDLGMIIKLKMIQARRKKKK
jgi:hypothetical protein